MDNAKEFLILILSSSQSAWALDGMLWSMFHFWRELQGINGYPTVHGRRFRPRIVIATDSYNGIMNAMLPKKKNLFDVEGLSDPSRVHKMRYMRQQNVELTLVEQKHDVPFDKWNSGFFIPTIEEVRAMGFSHGVVLLDDYWLSRTVDPALPLLVGMDTPYADRVLKVDLASDVLYSDPGKFTYNNANFGTYHHYDMIEKVRDAAYYFSLWGGAFHLEMLLDFSRECASNGWESPHNLEMEGTHIARNYWHDPLHLGTRQAPLRHMNVITGGKIHMDGAPQEMLDWLSKNKIDMGENK